MLSVLVPTRGRPHRVREVIEAVASTKVRDDTSLWFGVDHTDSELSAYYDALKHVPVSWVYLLETPSSTMVECLNQMARALLDAAKPSRPAAFMFMGDDHRPRTYGWDAEMLTAATLAGGPGIAYGNDLVQGINLPTQVTIDARIIEALGSMAPDTLTHLYVDNYWKSLGEAAGCLRYLHHVVIEHVHPITGKVPMDEGYARVNAGDMYARDEAAFRTLRENGQLDIDVARVLAVIEKARES